MHHRSGSVQMHEPDKGAAASVSGYATAFGDNSGPEGEEILRGRTINNLCQRVCLIVFATTARARSAARYSARRPGPAADKSLRPRVRGTKLAASCGSGHSTQGSSHTRRAGSRREYLALVRDKRHFCSLANAGMIIQSHQPPAHLHTKGGDQWPARSARGRNWQQVSKKRAAFIRKKLKRRLSAQHDAASARLAAVMVVVAGVVYGNLIAYNRCVSFMIPLASDFQKRD